MSKRYKSKKFLVKTRYVILATILFLLALGLVLLPKYHKNEGINPELFVINAVSTERYIDIPEEILEKYAIWRPSPLFRAYDLEKALDTPAKIYYKN